MEHQLEFGWGPSLLYHTTSIEKALEILKQRKLQGREFISFSERPLFKGDISAKEIAIAFHREEIASQLIQVEYTPQWADQHPEEMAYIAGEGWMEQFQYQSEDEEEQEKELEEARLESFLFKSEEEEWISKKYFVKFRKKAVAYLVLNPQDARQFKVIKQMFPGMEIVLEMIPVCRQCGGTAHSGSCGGKIKMPICPYCGDYASTCQSKKECPKWKWRPSK